MAGWGSHKKISGCRSFLTRKIHQWPNWRRKKTCENHWKSGLNGQGKQKPHFTTFGVYSVVTDLKHPSFFSILACSETVKHNSTDTISSGEKFTVRRWVCLVGSFPPLLFPRGLGMMFISLILFGCWQAFPEFWAQPTTLTSRNPIYPCTNRITCKGPVRRSRCFVAKNLTV